ncbi:hypothetical protein BT63DRAFT_421358 [Microthyrium microscopicum]|uniref:DUF3176 domain-containing protein n=1 Tax=Microthyrium microscopicum TaxID=703497 RepID=A0A6A6UP17_9PEZI|nr:hypothetical protein BT63DRAFT_421358 [Microthyrium microscopicum]
MAHLSVQSQTVLDEHLSLSPRTPDLGQFPSPVNYGSVTPTSEHHPFSERSSTQFQKSFVEKFQNTSANFTFNSKGDEQLSQSSASHTVGSRLQREIEDGWLWEALSWVISAGCMLALTVLLGLYNNKPLPARWPSGISLNAAISVLSSIGKYALSVPLENSLGQLKWIWFRSKKTKKLIDLERFDEASRGPWGAFLLLWHIKGKKLASFAAVITILSLAMDPFFQQIVAYPQRPGEFGKSTITRAVKFFTHENLEYANGGNYSISDESMWSAMESAYFGDGKESKIDAFCPTSNCQWPEFQTLGVCSKCHDASELLQFGCMPERGEWLTQRSTAMLGINQTISTAPVLSCGWFFNASSEDRMLMSGYVLDNTTSPPSPGEALFIRSLATATPADADNVTYWDRSYYYKNESNALPFWDFLVVMNKNVSSVYLHERPEAAECVLQWCVKNITASVINGEYKEEIVSTFINETQVGYPARHESKWRPPGTSYMHGVADVIIEPPGQDEQFFVPDYTVFQTVNPFYCFIPSYMTVANITANPLMRVDNKNTGGMDNSYILNFNLTEWSKPSNISVWSDIMATAVTNTIRSFPNSSEPVPGFGGLETYIHIQWAWISLPVIILFGTAMLLICVIITGPTKQEGGVWKTSPLPMLLHGPSSQLRADFGDAWSMYDMRRKARQVDVVLREEVDGLRFHPDKNGSYAEK